MRRVVVILAVVLAGCGGGKKQHSPLPEESPFVKGSTVLARGHGWVVWAHACRFAPGDACISHDGVLGGGGGRFRAGMVFGTIADATVFDSVMRDGKRLGIAAGAVPANVQYVRVRVPDRAIDTRTKPVGQRADMRVFAVRIPSAWDHEQVPKYEGRDALGRLVRPSHS